VERWATVLFIALMVLRPDYRTVAVNRLLRDADRFSALRPIM